MVEYIEREALVEHLEYLNNELPLITEHDWGRAKGYDEVIDEIKKYPSADVQPVVRCKDCKHFHLDYFGEVNGVNIIVAHEICDLLAGGCRTMQNAFCSNGVRMDGGA